MVEMINKEFNMELNRIELNLKQINTFWNCLYGNVAELLNYFPNVDNNNFSTI